MHQAAAVQGHSRWLRPESLIYALGVAAFMTVASRGAGLVRTVVFARLMDRTELGIWAISNNTIQFFSIVLLLGIPLAANRYVARYQQDGQLRSFLVCVAGLVLGISMAAGLLGIVLCRPLAQMIYEDTGLATLAILTCLGTVAMMAFNMVQGVLQGLRVNRVNGLIVMAQSIGFAILGSLMLVAWRPTAIAGAWAFLIISVAVTAVPVIMLWRHVHAEPAGPSHTSAVAIWRQVLVFSLANWAGSSLHALWRAMDRYMILHFDTLDTSECLRQIGTYHIIENVTAPLLALGGGWGLQVLAHAVHLWETKRTREASELIQLATKLSILILTMAAAVLIVFKRFVLAQVFGDSSMATGEILELSLTTTILITSQSMLRCYTFCREQVWRVTVMWGVAVVTSFVANLVLIPAMHLKGAVVAALISSSAAVLTILWLSHRAGLRLATSAWIVQAIPFALLLPVNFMLPTLLLVIACIARYECVLTEDEKLRLNMTLGGFLTRRFGRAGTVTACKGDVRQALA